MDGIKRLTKEQRAFIAGIIAKDCDGCDHLEIDRTLPERIDAYILRDPGADLTFTELLAKISEYFDADEAHLSDQLAQEGPNLAKPIQYWGPNEWIASVTAMAHYRHYLQRELSSCNDFLACNYVQNANELSNIANNFAEAMEAQRREIPTPDTFWCGRLLRRIVTEAKRLISA